MQHQHQRGGYVRPHIPQFIIEDVKKIIEEAQKKRKRAKKK
jgi:hypothetical protein